MRLLVIARVDRTVWLSFLAVVMFTGTFPLWVEGQEERPDAAREYFTDVPLLTQDGRRVHLYSDLMKDKVVVIDTFFISCTGICPRMTATLEGLQSRLGILLGSKVFFLSFSVDPESDTPDKLKEYAALFDARPGWYFLTGTKENVDLALSRFGPKISRKEDHSTLFLIGNNRTGLWKKVLAPSCTPESLREIVESVLRDDN